MSTIILIDANSVGYAAQHATKLTTGDQPTQAIYNVLTNLRALKSKYRNGQFLYLWDRKAQFRYDLHPDYKGKRDQSEEQLKSREEYHAQQPFIQRMLSSLGIPQLHHEGREADDIGYRLSIKYANAGHKVVLVSSDKDWLQMVAAHENISWYDPRLDRDCFHDTFAEFTGFQSVQAFVDAKCILGDKSDCINGIPGLGEKACELIFARWDSVKAMLDEYKRLGSFSKDNIGAEFSRYINKLNAFCCNPDLIKLYVRNRKLMDLSKAPECSNLVIDKGKKSSDDFFALCEELAFHSILAKHSSYRSYFFSEELSDA